MESPRFNLEVPGKHHSKFGAECPQIWWPLSKDSCACKLDKGVGHLRDLCLRFFPNGPFAMVFYKHYQ